jgi:hypothetical protein
MGNWRFKRHFTFKRGLVSWQQTTHIAGHFSTIANYDFQTSTCIILVAMFSLLRVRVRRFSICAEPPITLMQSIVMKNNP